MGASLLDGNVYIVRDVRNGTAPEVFICSSELLPYDGINLQGAQYTLHRDEIQSTLGDGFDASFLGLEVWFESIGVLSADPSQGHAPIATLHHILVDEEANPRTVNIRFWSFNPRADSVGEMYGFQRLSPIDSINIRGMLKRSTSHPWHSSVYSGSHLLLLVQSRGMTSLQLVRYASSASSASVHLLDLPPDIDVESITSICLDDHSGTVYLMVDSSVLFSLPYA